MPSEDREEQNIVAESNPEQMTRESDPVRETEEELLGFEQLSLTEEEEQENSKYLASVAVFGNQMMLELMKNRLSLGQKPRGGDQDGFTVLMEYLDVITEGYNEKVNKDNFPTKYGNMLVKYSDLTKACALYSDSRNGKRHIRSGERQIEKTRLHQVDQISQIAQREMVIIRQRGGLLAKSEQGMTWKELFRGEGEMEKAKLQAKGNQTAEPGLSVTSEPVVLGEETEEKEPTIQGLQKELRSLQEKCEAIQKALEKMLKSQTPEPENTGRQDEPA